MVREKTEKKPSRLDHKRPSKRPISDPQISFLRKGKMAPGERTWWCLPGQWPSLLREARGVQMSYVGAQTFSLGFKRRVCPTREAQSSTRPQADLLTWRTPEGSFEISIHFIYLFNLFDTHLTSIVYPPSTTRLLSFIQEPHRMPLVLAATIHFLSLQPEWEEQGPWVF